GAHQLRDLMAHRVTPGRGPCSAPTIPCPGGFPKGGPQVIARGRRRSKSLRGAGGFPSHCEGPEAPKQSPEVATAPTGPRDDYAPPARKFLTPPPAMTSALKTPR